jgi:hypothetical protein
MASITVRGMVTVPSLSSRITAMSSLPGYLGPTLSAEVGQLEIPIFTVIVPAVADGPDARE